MRCLAPLFARNRIRKCNHALGNPIDCPPCGHPRTFAISRLVRGHRRSDALARNEFLEVIEMPLSEAMSMRETGAIRDAKPIMGLQAVYLGTEAGRKNARGGSHFRQEPPQAN
jgi:hypothetical protein